jgi:NADH pyrophosphatase NudC (nudix superfamily)
MRKERNPMTTPTRTPSANGATETPVPPELREAYDALANNADVNAAVASYWRHDPNPTPEGAIEVRHLARLARAEQHRERIARAREMQEALARYRICPGCGLDNAGRTAWTELCAKCQRADYLQAAEDDSREVLDGRFRGAGVEVTRRELVALYRKERPR